MSTSWLAAVALLARLLRGRRATDRDAPCDFAARLLKLDLSLRLPAVLDFVDPNDASFDDPADDGFRAAAAKADRLFLAGG